MKSTLDKLKNVFSGQASQGDYTDGFVEDDYVEIGSQAASQSKDKVLVRPFTVTDFADIKPALDALREGYTVALINIKPIRDRDSVELRRAVSKLKKTCDAIEGDIAGFGEDWIVVTPSFAKIHRSAPQDNAPINPIKKEDF